MKTKKVSIEDIIQYLGSDIVSVFGPTKSVYIYNIPDASNVGEESLDWVNSSKTGKQEIAENSRAKVWW